VAQSDADCGLQVLSALFDHALTVVGRRFALGFEREDARVAVLFENPQATGDVDLAFAQGDAAGTDYVLDVDMDDAIDHRAERGHLVLALAEELPRVGAGRRLDVSGPVYVGRVVVYARLLSEDAAYAGQGHGIVAGGVGDDRRQGVEGTLFGPQTDL
jgi:hypothetical protein